MQQSLGGAGRDLLFLTEEPIAGGTLYRDGQKVGECFANGSEGRAHADTPFLRGSWASVPVLSRDETQLALKAAGYRPHGTDRAKMIRIGESLTSGFERYARPDVIARFLVERDGMLIPRIFDGEKVGQRIGRRLWVDLVRGARNLDRSAEYGKLVQSLALHAAGLECAASQRWLVVRALAEYTGAGGKAREKTYRLGKDTAALIGKVATGAPRDGEGCFTIPQWVRGERAGVVVVAAVQAAEAVRPGRPSTLTADELLRWYGEEAGKRELVGSRRADAEALGVSVPTLDRLDRQLRERGEISIETLPGRAGRRVTLTPTGAIKTLIADYPEEVLSGPDASELEFCAGTPDSTDARAQCIEGSPKPPAPASAEAAPLPPTCEQAPPAGDVAELGAAAAPGSAGPEPAVADAAARERPQGAPPSGDPRPAAGLPRPPRPFDPAEWARRWRGPQEVKRYARIQASAPEPRPEPAPPPRAAQVVLPLGPADPLLAELAAILEERDELPAPPPMRRSSAELCKHAYLPPLRRTEAA